MIDCTSLFPRDDELETRLNYLLNLYARNEEIKKILMLCYKIVASEKLYAKFKEQYKGKAEPLYIECPYCKEKNSIGTEFCIRCGWDFGQEYHYASIEKNIKEMENFIKDNQQVLSKEQRTGKVQEKENQEKEPADTQSFIKHGENKQEKIEKFKEKKSPENIDKKIPQQDNRNKTVLSKGAMSNVENYSIQPNFYFVPYLKNLTNGKETLLKFKSNNSTKAGVFRIGRNPDNDLIITEEETGGYYRQFSRYHTEIYKTKGEYYIKDTSTNGTYVNNRKIHKEVIQLFGGEIIEYKNYKLVFFFKQRRKEAK